MIFIGLVSRQPSGDGRQLGPAPFNEPLPMFSIGPTILTPEISPTINYSRQKIDFFEVNKLKQFTLKNNKNFMEKCHKLEENKVTSHYDSNDVSIIFLKL